MSHRSRFSVTIEGRTRVVELEDLGPPEGEPGAGDRGGGLRVSVDGRPRTVDVRALGGGAWSLLTEGSARWLQVDGQLPKLTVDISHPDGEPRLCVAEVAGADGGGGPALPTGGGTPARRPDGVPAGSFPAGPVTVRSPIPGRLVKVLVKPGDAVKAGQALLILEAMKMENELRAPRAATVSAVHAAEGSAVESGQELVSLT